MATKFGGLEYQDTISQILKDFGLLKVLRDCLSKSEHKTMLGFLEKRPKPSEIYLEWIGPHAKYTVPVSSKIKKITTELNMGGKSGPDAKEWKKISDLLAKDFEKEFDSKIIPAMFKHKAFWTFHDKNLMIVLRGKYGDPAQIANKLGIKKKADWVQWILESAFRGNSSKALKDAKTLMVLENLAGTPKDVVNAITSKGSKKLKKKWL